MSFTEDWYYVVGALGVISTIVFAVIKFKPEDTKVYIESADRLVSMADRVADMTAAQMSELNKRVETAEAVSRDLNQKYGKLHAQMHEMRRDKHRLEEENTRLRQVALENERLRSRVGELEAKVAYLQNQLDNKEDQSG